MRNAGRKTVRPVRHVARAPRRARVARRIRRVARAARAGPGDNEPAPRSCGGAEALSQPRDPSTGSGKMPCAVGWTMHGRRLVLRLCSRPMRAWIARRAHEGLARFDRDNCGANLRVTANDGAVWVNIADHSRGWAKVANSGWQRLDDEPAILRRPDAKRAVHRSERSHTVDARQPSLTPSSATETGEYEADIADAKAERAQTQTVAGSEADVSAGGDDGTGRHLAPRGLSGMTGLADGLAELRHVEALSERLDAQKTRITKGHGR